MESINIKNIVTPKDKRIQVEATCEERLKVKEKLKAAGYDVLEVHLLGYRYVSGKIHYAYNVYLN